MILLLVCCLCAVAFGQLELVEIWTARSGFRIEAAFFENDTSNVVVFERDPTASKVYLFGSNVSLNATQFSIGTPFSDRSVIAGGDYSASYRLYYDTNYRAPNYLYTFNHLSTYVSPGDEYLVAYVNANLSNSQSVYAVVFFEILGDSINPISQMSSLECTNSYFFRKKYSIATQTFYCVNQRVVSFYHLNIADKNVTLFQTLSFSGGVFTGGNSISADGSVFVAGYGAPDHAIHIFTFQNETFIATQNITLSSMSNAWAVITASGNDIFIGIGGLNNPPIPFYWYRRVNNQRWTLHQQIEIPANVTYSLADIALSVDDSHLMVRTVDEVFLYRINYPQPTTQVSLATQTTFSVLWPSDTDPTFATDNAQSSSSVIVKPMTVAF
jgi:hypothetical protein